MNILDQNSLQSKIVDAAKAEAPPSALLLDAKCVASLLGISLATVHRMKAAGKLPPHVALSGGCHRWRATDIRDWVADGCPEIRRWEAQHGRGK